MDERSTAAVTVDQPWLLFEADTEDTELTAFASGSAAVFSARKPGKSSPNEDAAALIPTGPDSGVLIVADGCGGTARGGDAARTVVEALNSAIATAIAEHTVVRSAILDGIEQANQLIQSRGTGSATTVAVLEIEDNTIRPYHVGDSTILLIGGHGKIKLHTTPHSPVGYAVESGLLNEEEAIHHEDRHFVSNIVGSPEMHIELGPTLTMARRDSLLIASDGLLDNLQIDEITQRIRKGSLLEASNRLVREVRSRMDRQDTELPSKPDDLTFILFRRKD